jgi:hypothetical protein
MNISKMNSKNTTRRTSLWAALCLSLAVSACASLAPGKPEDQVRQRASERWQALIKGEFTRAYSYSTPGFKAVVAAEAFQGRFGGAVTWVAADVVRVTCDDANKCVANIRLEFKPAMSVKKGATLTSYFDETWLRDAGQWWFFQKI